MSEHRAFLEQAIQLASQNVADGSGGPFGAVVVRHGVVIGTGVNLVTETNDPTAHAEIVAIRKACAASGSFALPGCTIYTSCEPCPMCLSAIYWARLDAVYYACTHTDAAEAGFDDLFIYRQLALPPEKRRLKMVRLEIAAGEAVFKQWTHSADRVEY